MSISGPSAPEALPVIVIFENKEQQKENQTNLLGSSNFANASSMPVTNRALVKPFHFSSFHAEPYNWARDMLMSGNPDMRVAHCKTSRTFFLSVYVQYNTITYNNIYTRNSAYWAIDHFAIFIFWTKWP